MLTSDPKGLPLSAATPDELNTYLADLIAANTDIAELRYWCRQLRGAQTSILSGEQNLEKIQAAEAQFDDLSLSPSRSAFLN